MKDVIIIGGGPTGSTCASFLAMEGMNVTVYEREQFPREHVGESLIPFCHGIFQKLGVLDQMEAGFNRKPGVKFTDASGELGTTWYFDHVIKDESALSFHVERAKFDNILLRNAEKKGAEVIEETAVTAVDMDRPDGSVEVRLRGKDGKEFTDEAKFLIDASGLHTFLARQRKDKTNFEGLDRIAITTHWLNPSYDKELEEGCIEIVHLGGEKMGWIWMIPLAGNRLSVGTVMYTKYYKDAMQQYKGDKEGHLKLYLHELKESGVAQRILQNAEIEHDVNVVGDYSYYAEKKYGENFAMMGDASAFLDPVFSSGIYMGIKSADLICWELARKIREGLTAEETIKKGYDKIDAAYVMVEKLIRTFYDPNAISLASLAKIKDEEFEKFESAYAIYHFMLAGDFFENNNEKYLNTIDMLKDSKNLEKYKNLINSKYGDPENRGVAAA